MSTIYKPLKIIFGLLGGLLAGKIVDQIWGALGHEDEAPDPDMEGAQWGEVLTAALIQGAVVGVVRAIIQKSGAHAIARNTGQWPGQTDE